MKTVTDSDFLIIITSLIVFFFLLGAALTIFVLFYYKKRSQHLREKQQIQENFERSLLQSQLEIQQQAFTAISQEIHDNVGQILSLSKVQLNIVEKALNPIPPLFGEVKNNITKAMADLREIAKSINGEKFQHWPLSKIIEEEAARIDRTNLIKATVLVKGIQREIIKHKKLILYRIVQEALQNILKHADATKIYITLEYLEDAIVITVQDNGRGFDVVQEKNSGKGLGLQNIFTRARLIDGYVDIESNDGGTVLHLTISNLYYDRV